MYFLSFDFENDDFEVLLNYVDLYFVIGDFWIVVCFCEEDLKGLLWIFDVIVIFDNWGGYEYNVVVFYINVDGKFVGVFDICVFD